jgi:hypothetical protein
VSDDVQARLLFTRDLSAATAEIARAGGRVLQVLTSSVVVAEMPDDIALAASTGVRPGDLDETSARLSDAWEAAKSKKAPTEILPWDTPGKKSP